MKRIYNILFLLFVVSFTFGQSKGLLKANKLYSNQAYAEAIPLYEKELQKNPNDKLILTNLGNSYRLTNNVDGQIKCFGALVNSGNGHEIHKLYYGQALNQKGDKENATRYFNEYLADARGKALASSLSKMKQYTKNADAYQISFASFNSTQNDFGAVMFTDEVVYVSNRDKTKWINRKHGWTGNHYSKVYTYQRSEGDLIKLFMGDLNSKYNDGPVCFTKDFNTVYFTRNNVGKKNRADDGTYKLIIARASLGKMGFDSVKLFGFMEKNYNYAHPALAPDERTLYFASDMPGGFGGMDLYMCNITGDGMLSEPINMGNAVNTAGNEMFPFMAEDGLFYFSSDGHDGLGGLDIYEAKMKDGKPVKIYNMGEPVNSVFDDFSYYLSASDPFKGFFSSNRQNGGMDDDVYYLTVLRKVSRGKNVTFVLKDKNNGDIIPGVKLTINGDTGTTDEAGKFTYLIEEDVDYNVAASNENYFDTRDSLNTKVSEEDEFEREIKMEKDPKLSFFALVTDVKSKQPLEGVTIVIKDLFTKAVLDSVNTNSSGEYKKPLQGYKMGDKMAYSIVLSKPGYVTHELNYTAEVKQEGEIKLHEALNMALGKVMIGMDLSKMIELNPIYFDVGKALVRKDAAIELDKIVKVMNEYPNMIVELGAHTDCRGAAKANLTLSDKRAKASAAYIIKSGIAKDRISGKGYGESKLLNGCACEGKKQSSCSEEEHAANRRTEFIITKLK